MVGLFFSLQMRQKEFAVLLFLCGSILLIDGLIVRKMLAEINEYSGELEKTINGILLNNKIPKLIPYKESILSKNQMQFKKLCESIEKRMEENKQEKLILQGLVSDISHQVKTPIANIVLYISALRSEELSPEKRVYYLNVLSEQVSKLDFLMADLLKMSRLEIGVLALEPQALPIQETLARALGGIAIKAEEKNIRIGVQCQEELRILHDMKWTCEALENILDNAVKYTPFGGRINVSVIKYEIYSVIEIEDTGIGIAREEMPKIFKRFYRGGNVRNESGVGIGLYLAREIISLEKGFIRVESAIGKGSKFSIFLLNG